MKKVLIFSLAYYPAEVGGAEVAIKEITDRVSPADISFHMITLRLTRAWPKVEQIGNVRVHRIGFGGRGRLSKFFFQFTAALAALRLHKKEHYSCVWAMMAHSCGVPAALFKMAQPKVPYVLTLQEGDPPAYIERLMLPLWPLFSRAFTSATVVQAISKFLGDWARKRGFTGPLEIIPNGANAKDFADDISPQEIEALKQQLGKKPGDIYIVSTSRLTQKNGLDSVVRALPLLPLNIYFIVVGSGADDTALHSLAKEQGVSNRVKFIGHVDRSHTPLYRKVSDIFARPSRSEGMGNSFLGAFAARLPVIATQEGGIAEFLFDAKRNPDKPTTGWAVDKDSPQQIADAVKDILGNPERVKKVTDTAYALAKENYNWDTIAKRMREEVFGRVI